MLPGGDFAGRRVGHVHHATVVLVGEGQTGVAQVVADGVFVAQQVGAGRACIDIENPPLRMKDAFQAESDGSRTAVFYPAQVILLVLQHAVVGHRLAQFASRAVVEYVDDLIACEGEPDGQVQVVVVDGEGFVGVGGEVAIGIIGVLGRSSGVGRVGPTAGIKNYCLLDIRTNITQIWPMAHCVLIFILPSINFKCPAPTTSSSWYTLIFTPSFIKGKEISIFSVSFGN